ncbi:MAG TPA: tail protein X [Thiotrichales bacterium]|nr:tail protein X [Thiotrichales bacterium]
MIIKKIVTVEGDRLDKLCHQHYQDVSMIKTVIAFNPQLTGIKQPYVSGIEIMLPPKEEPPAQQKTAIW